jgi:hypothetical protein
LGIDRRTCGILEGVPHGITDDRRLVSLTAPTAVIPRFQVLLGIIPEAAGPENEEKSEDIYQPAFSTIHIKGLPDYSRNGNQKEGKC